MDVSNLIDGLNDAKREAVCAPFSNQHVLTGADSGKTHVLVQRITWLLRRHWQEAKLPNFIDKEDAEKDPLFKKASEHYFEYSAHARDYSEISEKTNCARSKAQEFILTFVK